MRYMVVIGALALLIAGCDHKPGNGLWSLKVGEEAKLVSPEQNVTQPALHVLLAQSVGGVFGRRKVEVNVPLGVINRRRPEIVGHIEVLRDSFEEENDEVGEDGVEIKIANAR